MGTFRRHRAAIICILIASYCVFLPVSHSADKKPVVVSQSDKCPVCGMFVAKYKGWIAQVVFSDGTYAAFDGPKDMFRFYFDPGKYISSKKKADFSGVYVTEYYTAKIMEAEKLFFVLGSDVYGPMGAELVPVSSMVTAKEFMRDHKGNKIIKFSEITPGDLN